jgi:hypothetical protein
MLDAATWDLLTKISATLGPGAAGLLLYFLYRSDKERRESQAQLFQIAVKGVEVMTGAANAINAMKQSTDELRRQVAALQTSVRANNRGRR